MVVYNLHRLSLFYVCCFFQYVCVYAKSSLLPWRLIKFNFLLIWQFLANISWCSQDLREINVTVVGTCEILLRYFLDCVFCGSVQCQFTRYVSRLRQVCFSRRYGRSSLDSIYFTLASVKFISFEQSLDRRSTQHNLRFSKHFSTNVFFPGCDVVSLLFVEIFSVRIWLVRSNYLLVEKSFPIVVSEPNVIFYFTRPI